jgi:putative sterol carrier protein
MAAFGTREWLELFQEKVNASEAYRAAAATWEGEVAFVFESEPDRGWPVTVHALLDLWHGECRKARIVSEPEAEAAPFVIRAPFTRWKQVLERDLDPIKGMMQGKLRLRGDLPTIVRYVKAANELVNLATEVPTEFPDEAAQR